jgi:signal transduction histidine kinase
MSDGVDTDLVAVSDDSVGRLPRVWLLISIVSLAVGFALTFDPSFADPASTLLTLLPFVLLPMMGVLFTQLPVRGPSTALTAAAVVSVAAWAVLVFDDDRWTVLTFALYGLCFSLERTIGLLLAATVTVLWMAAWVVDDGPAWRLVIPPAVFVAGMVIWLTLHRAGSENSELANTIAELRATQRDLAESEHAKGVLEERARMAGEIHDTLAQGFTSIVLLARAGRRDRDTGPLGEIEAVATDHLQAARRLVAAVGPGELDGVALPDAVRRQVAAILSDDTTGHVEVTGEPAALSATVDVTVLRGLQETLRNIELHANATEVHVTLSYLDELVVLDVSDNGNGFAPGAVSDRGDLTGGQGLRSLRRRIESLGGQLEIESTNGAVVSIRLPAVAS